jgi:hypothetical protein
VPSSLASSKPNHREAVVVLLEGQTPEHPEGTDFIPGEYDYDIIPLPEQPVLCVLETVAA